MNDLIISPVGTGDFAGIGHIHRNCDDPWRDAAECAAWLTRRMERGFYIQAARLRGRVVGHGEWILSEEPRGRRLYLGMLQVDSDFQRRGIGREMMEDGARHARALGCCGIFTIPYDDPIPFYEKCGLREQRRIYRCVIPTAGAGDDPPARPRDGVPFEAVARLPLVFGLAQASARHMWEVCNAKPATDERCTPAAELEGGDYIQLSYFDAGEGGLALGWSAGTDTVRLIDAALALGREHGLPSVTFLYPEEQREAFGGRESEYACSEWGAAI